MAFDLRRMTQQPNQAGLRDMYHARFGEGVEYRDAVWRILCRDFFASYVPTSATVLDLGCGYGWFINNIECAQKLGMDLNPAAEEHLDPDVRLLLQDCAAPWPLDAASLDVVFTSNFLEHLLTKAQLSETLREVKRCLKPGGLLMALGPNIKYLGGRYWDFFDHYLPLTELALKEELQVHGFQVTRALGRFLPYTMVGRTPPLPLVRLYLRLPFLWPIVGKQFLVTAVTPR